MKGAILTKSRQLCANLLRILSGLHQQKRVRGVDEMLHRLYEPILWRHLKAANSSARRNALNLMLDAFPIQARRFCVLPSCQGAMVSVTLCGGVHAAVTATSCMQASRAARAEDCGVPS